MPFSGDTVKLRSLGLWSFLLVTAPLTLGGCIIVADDHDHYDHHDGWYDDEDDPPLPPAETPALVALDTDALLHSEPGDGVGIFVEYAAGGTWTIWTTCDTDTSGAVCRFDVYASVDTSSELFDLWGSDLEGADRTWLIDQGVAKLEADTDWDADAMMFSTTPGAIVRIEAYLDGDHADRFIYWFGNGVLHKGAPTNPLDFEPTVP